MRRAPYELFVQFQDSTISNLPRTGVGVGSVYYANTAQTLQNGAIMRNAWASSRELFGVSGLFIKAGRQLYSNAVEAPATDPSLAWLQYNRLSQRLIGPFDYTHIGRSFDGGQVGYDAAQWNATAFGFKPTFGGYEVDGTFFQMLPTAWLYAQFPFYNMMNNQDVLAECIVDPHPRLSLRLDFHWLRVNSSKDFVYFGGGRGNAGLAMAEATGTSPLADRAPPPASSRPRPARPADCVALLVSERAPAPDRSRE